MYTHAKKKKKKPEHALHTSAYFVPPNFSHGGFSLYREISAVVLCFFTVGLLLRRKAIQREIKQVINKLGVQAICDRLAGIPTHNQKIAHYQINTQRVNREKKIFDKKFSNFYGK